MVKKLSIQKIYRKLLNLPSQRYTSLTSLKYRQELERVVDEIYAFGEGNPEKILAIFNDFRKHKFRLTLRLGAKIAHSYALITKVTKPACVSVIFPVYNEKNRLHRSGDHPNGENFLRAKISRLEKLFKMNPKLRWRLLIVDDGSSDGTGHIIKFILENEYPEYLKSKKVQVLFMTDALKEKPQYLENLKSIKDSGKGSSILYGLDKARKTIELKPNEEHILVYTDADLSVHLGQLGSAIYNLIEGDCEAILGQRRLHDSVILRPKFKSARGKFYIYLLKQLLPQLKGFVVDPQAPFKVIKESALKKIFKFMREPGFSFDVEFLLLLKLYNISTCPMGIGFIDSNKESHTNSNTTHLRILKSIVNIRKRHLPRSPADSDLEHFIKSLTENDWLILTNNIPYEIKKGAVSSLDKKVIPISVFNKILNK